jgi:hypothetical protein
MSRAPALALFDAGNPPPPRVTIQEEDACSSEETCVTVECALEDAECFAPPGLAVTVLRTPTDTWASLEFVSVPNRAISDRALVRDNGKQLVGQGSLEVFFNGVWLSIDMASVRGSLLLTNAQGMREMVIEANAFFPDGHPYPNGFFFKISFP